jgi:drug/metabolite transporter superfamily protein YnfA
VERLLIIGGLFVAAGLCEIGGGYLVWDGSAITSPWHGH